MFEKLPELFSRNFAIGFFLPVAAFLVSTLMVFDEYDLLQLIEALNSGAGIDVLIGTTMLGLISWFGGIILLAANRDIYRLLEGYGRFNPLRPYIAVERRRFRKLHEDLRQLKIESDGCKERNVEFPKQKMRGKLAIKAVERFPHEEDLVLPTSFGNIIRAFEAYPLYMYGLDAIAGGNRILAVIPDDYRSLVDDSKVLVDFWLNLGFLSILSLLGYLGLGISQNMFEALWAPTLMVIIIIVSYLRAKSCAVEWGDMFKSSIDVFLPELRKQLGFPQPLSLNDERAMWIRFSQAIAYGLPNRMPARELKDDDNGQDKPEDA